LFVCAVACTTPTEAPDPPADTRQEGDTGHTAPAATQDTGNTAVEPTAPAFVQQPLVTEVANEGLHLVRWLTAEVDQDSTLTVEWTDGVTVSSRDITVAATTHQLPLFGLHPDTTYQLTVVATGMEGLQTTSQSVSFSTAPLPPTFPLMEVLTLDATRMEPGLTLFDTQSDGSDFVVMLDAAMRVTWYLETSGDPGDLRLTDRGTLLGIVANRIWEIDLTGEAVGTWPDTFVHHAASALQDGGVIALVNESVDVLQYPTSYADPYDFTPATLQSASLYRLAADGTEVETVAMASLLDTKRIAFDSLNESSGGFEWTHANAVFPDPFNGGFIASLRHQDAVIKVDDAGDLEWILSNETGWTAEHTPYLFTPVGSDFSWPYHQHAPEMIDANTILLFDNGNRHYTPYEPNPHIEDASRVVAYELDTSARTITQLWEYKNTQTGTLHSGVFGDADLQPQTGNVLAVFGANSTEGGVENLAIGRGRKSARLIEFDPAQPDPPALDLRLYSDQADLPMGWKVYRAERTPDLYATWDLYTP